MEQVITKADHSFKILDELAPAVEISIPEDRRERYFFFAGDTPGLDYQPGKKYLGGMSVTTPCIPHKVLRRCQVTPCITVQQPARIPEIPDGKLIQGTQNFANEIAHGGYFRMVVKEGFAKYWLYAGPEAEQLLYNYGNKGNPDQSWGLTEIASDYLRGRGWQDVRNLHLTEIFFPMWPDIPTTNAEVLDVLQSRMREIPGEIDRSKQWVASDGRLVRLIDVYMQAAADMEWAIISAQEYQAEMVGRSNLAVTLPSTEPGYKRKFDLRDHLFSERTGIELAINSLRQNSGGALEKLADRLSNIVQPQVAPQIDLTQVAAIATAVVKALKDEGLLSTPDAGETNAKPSKK